MGASRSPGPPSIKKYVVYMWQCFSKQITLNQDLHPALLSLMNQPKLFEQEKHLSELASTSQWRNIEAVILLQNIRRVNTLDLWLKHYFTHDYDWA